MHPDDVAECVADEVRLLRARLDARPALRAGEPQLLGRFELRVPFTKVGFRETVPFLVSFGWSCPQCGPLRRVVEAKRGRLERDLILRSFCDQYDAVPITAELLDRDGEPLADGEWPRTLGREAIIRGHEEYKRPFFCRRGLREYHSHPQHEDDPWDRHREAVRIHDVIPELLYDLQTRWDVG